MIGFGLKCLLGVLIPVLAICAWLPAERSRASDYRIDLSGPWVPVGVTWGRVAHHPGASDDFLGLEGSVVRVYDFPRALAGGFVWWYGGYSDLVFDMNDHQNRLTLGPECGVQLITLDGGWVHAWGGGSKADGLAARLCLSLGICHFYVRAERFGPGRAVRSNTEFGVLLKWPKRVH